MSDYHGKDNREWCIIKNEVFISSTSDYDTAMSWYLAHCDEEDSYEVKLVTTIATHRKVVFR